MGDYREVFQRIESRKTFADTQQARPRKRSAVSEQDRMQMASLAPWFSAIRNSMVILPPSDEVRIMGKNYGLPCWEIPHRSGAERHTVLLIDWFVKRKDHIGGGRTRYWRGKKVKGRKRHIVTDTMGHLLCVKVHAANIHDTIAGGEVFQGALEKYPSIKGCCADAGYRKTSENIVLSLG